MYALLHYPQTENPHYAAETSGDYRAAWLESEMARLAREANGLEWQAYDMYDYGQFDQGNELQEMAAALWKRYVDARTELGQIETGDWE
jgi:hypothetical protein